MQKIPTGCLDATMYVRMCTKQEIPSKFFISCDFNENVADLFIHYFIH